MRRPSRAKLLGEALANLKPTGTADKSIVMGSLRIYILLRKLDQFQQQQNQMYAGSPSYYRLLVKDHETSSWRLSLLKLNPSEGEIIKCISQDQALVDKLFSKRNNCDTLDEAICECIRELLPKLSQWEQALKAEITAKEQTDSTLEYYSNLAIYGVFFLKHRTMIYAGVQFSDYIASYFKSHAARRAAYLGVAMCAAGYFYQYGVVNPAVYIFMMFAAGQVVEAQRDTKVILETASVEENTHIDVAGTQLPAMNEVWLLRLANLIQSSVMALITSQPLYIAYGASGMLCSLSANTVARLVTKLIEGYRSKTLDAATKKYAELIIASLGLSLGRSLAANYYREMHLRETIPMCFRSSLDDTGAQLPLCVDDPGEDRFAFPDLDGPVWPHLLKPREEVSVVRYGESNVTLFRMALNPDADAAPGNLSSAQVTQVIQLLN